MLSTSFFVLNRRLTPLKSVLSSYPPKFIRYNGCHGYSRNYMSILLRKSSCTSNIYNYRLTDFSNDFRVIKRCKQTSPDQENDSQGISKSVEEPPEKLSLFKRYRKMLKEYWYVLLPVHFVTSAFWFGGFYYSAKCGIDIVPFLEYINLPEKYIVPLRNSSLGYIAVASAFYKLATPARYMVTLGGTTFAVKFLTKRGLIRPAPTKAEMKTIIQNKLKKQTSKDEP